MDAKPYGTPSVGRWGLGRQRGSRARARLSYGPCRQPPATATATATTHASADGSQQAPSRGEGGGLMFISSSIMQ